MRFRMAYAIQCHKNADQVNRLINILQDEDVDFFIHVDKKSNIIEEIVSRENIYIVKERVNVIWGNFSQIEATMRLFKKIREVGEYSRIHLISGQDFPIKSREYIKTFFKDNSAQYIQYRKLPNDWAYEGMNRVKVYYPSIMFKNKIVKKFIGIYEGFVMKNEIFQRKGGIYNFYGGSSWFSLTGDCLEYIISYVDRNPSYYRFFKNTLCGDEIFFQTILVNSPFKNTLVNDNKRYIKWKQGDSSPNILTLSDYIALKESDKIWARKFDIQYEEILAKIEKDLL